jgi:hypothetical protein
LEGFKDGVFPGVFLLSRWRWSGFPVEVAILFGPVLIACVVIVLFEYLFGWFHEKGIALSRVLAYFSTGSFVVDYPNPAMYIPVGINNFDFTCQSSNWNF